MKIFYALFIILIFLSGIFAFFACEPEDDEGDDEDNKTDDDDNDSEDDDDNNDDATGDDDDDDDWVPVESHREQIGIWTVVWMNGTPYEMGYQHGTLLHEELKAGVDWLNSMHLIDILIPLANLLGLYDLALNNSYPDIIEECEGLVAAAGDIGWSMEVCMLLNFGDVLVEYLSEGFPPAKAMAPGCSEIAATGQATTDGRLYHGRILDWSQIDFLLDYPVIHVRQPDDGIPHAYIGFPGNMSPYSGINAEGISIASNEADPFDTSEQSRTGRSHVQMLAHLLKNVSSLDEAVSIVETEGHMSAELIMVTDGNAKEAAVFEMTAAHLGIRYLEDDALWATNHFVAPETKDADEDPAGSSSLLRFERLNQLMGKDHADSRWGQIDPAAMIEIMRDRINPNNGQESPVGTFDNNESLATNGALYQIVFDPENLFFWVAAGTIPVPEQEFTGFSLGELLELPGAVPCDPPAFE